MFYTVFVHLFQLLVSTTLHISMLNTERRMLKMGTFEWFTLKHMTPPINQRLLKYLLTKIHTLPVRQEDISSSVLGTLNMYQADAVADKVFLSLLSSFARGHQFTVINIGQLEVVHNFFLPFYTLWLQCHLCRKLN